MQEKLASLIKFLKEKRNPNFLYRIVATGLDVTDCAYTLQEYVGQKYLFVPQWKNICQSSDTDYLTYEMKSLALERNKKIPIPKAGEVFKIYTKEDLIVDKLKG